MHFILIFKCVDNRANTTIVIVSYAFLDNVGYFQADNAANTNTIIRSIAQLLINHDVSFNPES